MARQATLELVGDASKVISALKGAEGATDSFGDKVKGAGVKMTAFATVPIVGFLGAATKAAAEDAAAQAHLAKTLENTGNAHEGMAAAMDEYLAAAMKSSLFTDDQLRPAFESMVLTTGDAEKAMDLLDVAMDVAAGKGIELETASLAVAKASEGNFAAVNKLVPGLLDLSDKTLTAETATKKLSDLFGGQAQAATETAAGKAQMMTRDLGELTEGIGAALIPILTQLLDIVRPVIDRFLAMSEGTQKIIVIVGLAIAAIGPLIGVVTALSTAMAFLAANPIVLVIAAVAALAAGLIYAYKKSETFRDIVDATFRAVKSGIQTAWAVVEPVFNAWIWYLEKLFGAFTAVAGVAGKVGGFIGGAIGKIPGFATGGTVPGQIGSPQLVVAHGGETITPYARSGGGAGVVVNVTVPGLVGSEDQLARTIQSLLLQLQSRTGGLGFEAA
jgi:hypothetical protein